MELKENSEVKPAVLLLKIDQFVEEGAGHINPLQFETPLFRNDRVNIIYYKKDRNYL